jgi:hypothetical protein
MKKLSKLNLLAACGLALLTALYSCQKTGVSSNNTSTTTLSASVIASMQAIQLSSASTGSSSTTMVGPTTDAIFAIHAYPPGDKADSVTFASLPTTIGTYLTANYSGYTFQKAFKITTSAGSVDSYVVVILYNGKPVAIRFDSTGAFVAVLEQCEGHDMGDGGPGWHEGGRFGDRDGLGHDTVAISALPGAVKAYFTTNYPADTLLHAAVNMDGSYSVISADKGLFVTNVSAAGTLINRIQVYPHPNKHVAVTQSALLPAISIYLTSKYPGYVFDKAFAEEAGTTVLGYDVFIDVNGTRYALEFDASGNYVSSKVIR